MDLESQVKAALAAVELTRSLIRVMTLKGSDPINALKTNLTWMMECLIVTPDRKQQVPIHQYSFEALQTTLMEGGWETKRAGEGRIAILVSARTTGTGQCREQRSRRKVTSPTVDHSRCLSPVIRATQFLQDVCTLIPDTEECEEPLGKILQGALALGAMNDDAKGKRRATAHISKVLLRYPSTVQEATPEKERLCTADRSRSPVRTKYCEPLCLEDRRDIATLVAATSRQLRTSKLPTPLPVGELLGKSYARMQSCLPLQAYCKAWPEAISVRPFIEWRVLWAEGEDDPGLNDTPTSLYAFLPAAVAKDICEAGWDKRTNEGWGWSQTLFTAVVSTHVNKAHLSGIVMVKVRLDKGEEDGIQARTIDNYIHCLCYSGGRLPRNRLSVE